MTFAFVLALSIHSLCPSVIISLPLMYRPGIVVNSVWSLSSTWAAVPGDGRGDLAVLEGLILVAIWKI